MPSSPEESDTEAIKRFAVYDDVFLKIASFGRCQKLLFFCCGILNITLGTQFGLLVFAMGTPSFSCTTSNATCPVRKCCENCTSYEFSKEQFTSVATEWNLICDRAHIAASLQSCFFSGMAVGSLLGGLISDAFGRRLCMFLSCGILVISGVAASFADCLSLLGLLRFCIGFSLASFMLSSYIYMIELIGPQYRTMGGQISHVFYSPGYCLTALIGYFVRDWRYLNMTCCLLPAFFFLTWKVFPESARWLIANNRLDEALQVLSRYGSRSGSDPVDLVALKEVIKDIRRDQIEREQHAKRTSILDLLRTRKLRKRTLILAFNWFVVALVHFGFYLYVTSLAGNVYVNFVIMNSIYIPHLFFCWFLMHRYGRRFPYSSYMLSAGAASLLILAVFKAYPVGATVLAIIGKTLITTEFSNIYLFTSELYPTILRNTGIGAGSMSARLGGILAPYIVMTSQLPGVSLTLPVTIFGVSAVIAGILSLWLPETRYITLPQTIEEVETVKEDYSLPCRARHRIPDEPVMIELEKGESMITNIAL